MGKDQSAAARAAGYADGPGLKVTGARLMRDPAVQAELGRLRGVAETKAVATADEAVRLLTEQMRASFEDFVDENGFIDLGKARAAGKLKLLKRFSIGVDGQLRIEMHDSQSAIDRLAKILGWNAAERVDIKTSVDPAALSESELDALIKTELGRRGKA